MIWKDLIDSSSQNGNINSSIGNGGVSSIGNGGDNSIGNGGDNSIDNGGDSYDDSNPNTSVQHWQ